MSSLEERLEKQGIEVSGKFNAQKFFDTLALILSNKMNMKITVKVCREEEEQKNKAI